MSDIENLTLILSRLGAARLLNPILASFGPTSVKLRGESKSERALLDASFPIFPQLKYSGVRLSRRENHGPHKR